MAKTWVLDTETKGTGAHVVPLERATGKPSSPRELALIEFDRPSRPTRPIQPPAPLRFKVVDVRSAQVLGEGVTAHEAVELLENADSVVDVRIYLWRASAERWRLLTLAEQKTLWGFRGTSAAGGC